MNDYLEHARSHKYINKRLSESGVWIYEYAKDMAGKAKTATNKYLTNKEAHLREVANRQSVHGQIAQSEKNRAEKAAQEAALAKARGQGPVKTSDKKAWEQKQIEKKANARKDANVEALRAKIRNYFQEQAKKAVKENRDQKLKSKSLYRK